MRSARSRDGRAGRSPHRGRRAVQAPTRDARSRRCSNSTFRSCSSSSFGLGLGFAMLTVGRLVSPEPARRREALAVRVRLRGVRGRAHEVRRALLPRRDPVHPVRPRDRLPLPVGGRAAGHRLLRLRRDDGVPWRSSSSASSTSGRRARWNGNERANLRTAIDGACMASKASWRRASSRRRSTA